MKKMLLYIIVGSIALYGVYLWQKNKDESILKKPGFTYGVITDYYGGTSTVSAPKVGVNSPGSGPSVNYTYEVNSSTITSGQVAGHGLAYIGKKEEISLETKYVVVYNKDKPEKSRILLKLPLDRTIEGLSDVELLELVKSKYHIE